MMRLQLGRHVAAIIGWIFVLLGISCASLLQLAAYHDAVSEICAEAARCEPAFEVTVCERHVESRLAALSTEQRTAWLTQVAETAATSTCLPAQQAIDSPLLCLGIDSACEDGVQCCHFSAATAQKTQLCASAEAGRAKQCCEAKGFACEAGDCCAGDCSEEFGCCGGECCSLAGGECDAEKPCCDGVCRGGKCTEPCAGEGATCTSDSGCCDELYCNETSQRCERCLQVGDGCVGVGKVPGCCGRDCINGSTVGAEDVCSDCAGLPEGSKCKPGAIGVFDDKELQGGCCSGICDAPEGEADGVCRSCRSDGGNCSDDPTRCCDGFVCKEQRCTPCLSDGETCTADEAYMCCSGTCLRGVCASCSDLGDSCQQQDDTPCCEGTCQDAPDNKPDEVGDFSCQCLSVMESCQNLSDCCGPKGGVECKEFPSLMVPGETRLSKKFCCSNDKSASCDPCTPHKKPLSEDCLPKQGDAITQICLSHPECCCKGWADKPCKEAAHKAGLCPKDPNP